MALGFAESAAKYKEYHEKINKLKENLINAGYDVDDEPDVFEGNIVLSSTLQFKLNGEDIASLYWDAPYYLTFESKVAQDEKPYSIDYVQNLNDWNYFIDSIKSSLMKYKTSLK